MNDCTPSVPRNVTRIRELNDALRTTLSGGVVVVTQGIQALPPDAHAEVLKAVVLFSDFTSENDPFGDGDFGAFEFQGEAIFWKIDYYDKEQKFGSADPANPDVTTRVLTIMLAGEY